MSLYNKVSKPIPNLLFFDVEGLGGEGEFDVFGFEGAHDVEVDFLVDFEEKPIIRGCEPVKNQDVQGAIVEFGEINSRGRIGIAVDLFDVGEDFFDILKSFFDFVGGGVVGDADVEGAFNGWSFADVFDHIVRDFTVGNGDDMAVEGADTSGSKADFFDGTVETADADAITDSERSIGEDTDRTEEVGDGVLGGQSKGETTDTGGGEDGADILIENIIGDIKRCNDRDKYTQAFTDDRDEHSFESGFRQGEPFF